MNWLVPICVVVCAVCAQLAASAPACAADATELKERLQRLDAPHPRLFLSKQDEETLKAKLEGDPLLKGLSERIIAASEAAQDLAPVERKKVGKRLLGVSRACLQRVVCLSFAYRMTGSEEFLRRAEREMLAAAAFEDWNPSHFLDVGEMTAALAIGYDWLYEGLAPDARTTIRDAIIEKGLETSMKGGWWVTTTNNWNQVCHGGLVIGALAVIEDVPELSEQIIARALENVPGAMHEYQPDGVYPEGPSYWKYGTTYNVLLISALESVLGTDFGLASAPGFAETCEYYLHSTGPTGLFFNFSDCGTRGGISPAMHWFAARREEPSLLWWEKGELERLVAQDSAAGDSLDRTLVFLLIWAQPVGDVPAPKQLHWKGDGRTPVAMHRTGWGPDATFAAIKGGSPGTNHAHMDTGSFVLDMDGVRWGLDLGGQGYHGLESRGVDLWNKSQESERWTVFRLNNFSHNTLVIDGQLQRVKGHAPIIGFSGEADAPHTIVDLTPVYEGQIEKAHRGLRLVGRALLVQDELTALDRATSVRWGMTTQAEVTITADGAATLKQDGREVTLRVLSPEHAKLTVYDMEHPPREYDSTNPNTRMIGFEIEIPASASETLAVFVQPGPTAGDAPAIGPLEDW
ncbi:MAG: heparinase II/III family protein [Candidatus Hydrogenedentes bacterium]|nr:heparinase II/III family protein [Candidatus Hydrogenedentota bacterium]